MSDTKDDNASPSRLPGFGFFIFAIGLVPLIGVALISPASIVFRNAGSSEFSIMRDYHAHNEALAISWIFYLSPLVMLIGAILFAVGVATNQIKASIERSS